MNNIWIMSDSHYSHKNIVRGISEWEDLSRCRDFETLKEYNTTIVNSINDYVQKDDWLYHLGDWSFGGKDSIYDFRKRINCNNIVLIHGNHDHHIIKNAVIQTDNGFINCKNLFTSTHDILEKTWSKQKFVLCHYPIYSWHKQGHSIHLYGHMHEELNYHKDAICVSMECHPQFRPFSLEEILEIVKQRNEKKDEYLSNFYKRDSS